MVNLGTLGDLFPGFAFSDARDINDLGQVVGLTSVPGESHAFLWTAGGGMVDLGTLPGDSQSAASAINEAGQVVGRSEPASGASSRAFLWTTGGGMVDLGTLGGSSSASDINEAGVVVGRSETVSGGDEHPFLWTQAGGMVDLGTLGGATLTFALGINDVEQVVGSIRPFGGDDHAFYWTMSDGMIELPTLGGIESKGSAINNAGQVAGYAEIANIDEHAAVWTQTDPTAQIQALQQAVVALQSGGTLTGGQAASLMAQLNAALALLANNQVQATGGTLAQNSQIQMTASTEGQEGRNRAAASILSAFIRRVSGLVRVGVLTVPEGQSLIGAAQSIITDLLADTP